MTSLNLLDTFRVLLDHLESFKSKGNKSNALKNCPVLFLYPVGDSVLSNSTKKKINYEKLIRLIIK